jgi:hypothetical protein
LEAVVSRPSAYVSGNYPQETVSKRHQSISRCGAEYTTMAIRDLFDGMLVVAVCILLFVHASESQPSLRDLSVIVEVLTGLHVAIYLLFAGILGVLFVFLITVYAPRKLSQNTAR